MLDDLAANADAPSLLSVARSELPKLTEGWRALLSEHQPDGRGNCPSCSTRFHQQKAPCSVWRSAHQHLVSGDTPAPTAAPARHSRPTNSGVAARARAPLTATLR